MNQKILLLAGIGITAVALLGVVAAVQSQIIMKGTPEYDEMMRQRAEADQEIRQIAPADPTYNEPLSLWRVCPEDRYLLLVPYDDYIDIDLFNHLIGMPTWNPPDRQRKVFEAKADATIYLDDRGLWCVTIQVPTNFAHAIAAIKSGGSAPANWTRMSATEPSN
jgi:hypothetical protein